MICGLEVPLRGCGVLFKKGFDNAVKSFPQAHGVVRRTQPGGGCSNCSDGGEAGTLGPDGLVLGVLGGFGLGTGRARPLGKQGALTPHSCRVPCVVQEIA